VKTDVDDRWMIDAQGRKYRRDPLPKTYAHERLEENRLRTVWGIVVELDGEDAENFYIKVYKTDDALTGPVARSPSEEELAAIADASRFDLKTSRTLSFDAFDEGLPKAGQWRNGFALADMNKDGFLDIVHGPMRKRPGPPVIFLGNGQGHWRQWADASFPPQRFDYGDVAVADFDKDGSPDLALGMHLLGITALLNDGAGRFRTADRGMDPMASGDAFSSRAITTLDWDGDGRVDILALGEGPRLQLQAGAPLRASAGVVLYRNRGDGTWEKEQSGGVAAFGDVLAPLRVDRHRLAFVIGTNSRDFKDLLYLPGGNPWTVRPLAGLRPQALVYALAVADFDRDGSDDIAVGYASFELGKWHSGIDIMLQRRQAPGWARETIYVEDGPAGITALASGDLNHDGIADLVALTGDARVIVIVGGRRMLFTREEAELGTATPSCRGYRVAIADLDGDGYGDVVASFAGESEGFMTLTSPGCPGEGSLRAWRVRPRP
jgi:hypothetical protein